MARRKTSITLAQMVQPIRQFRDAAAALRKSLLTAKTNWHDCYPRIVDGAPSIPWETLDRMLSRQLAGAFMSLTFATNDLRATSSRMGAGERRDVIVAAVDLAVWAMEQAAAEGLGGHMESTQYSLVPSILNPLINSLERSCDWLQWVEDFAAVEALPTWAVEALQALDERGAMIGSDLARAAWGKDLGKRGERLANMVERGLLTAGRGPKSSGYRLTDRGRRLVQLSR